MSKNVGLITIFLWLVVHIAVVSAQDDLPIKLTELLYDPLYTDEQLEWVEVTNIGDDRFDLTGFRLGDEETIGGREGMAIFPMGSFIEAGRSIVIAQTAVAFEKFYQFKPDFEWKSSDPTVPVLQRDNRYAKGDVAFANGGDELILLDVDGVIIDEIVYGDSPAVQRVGAGQSIERFVARCDSGHAADFRPNLDPSPGSTTLDGDCGLTAVEEMSLTTTQTIIDDRQYPPIGTIQGKDAISPFVNQIVTIEGVVTGIHEDRNTAGITFYTLFVQDRPDTEDGDPDTSDAIAVFFGRNFPDAIVGDHLLVTGQVIEFFGLTEIASDGLQLTIIDNDVKLPSPVLLSPPMGNQDDYYERLEGMVVTAGDDPLLVLGATFDGCGLAVATPQQPPKPVIIRNSQDPIDTILPVIYRSDVTCDQFPDAKVGDMLAGLQGNLTYNFDQFKLLQQHDTLQLFVADFPPLPIIPAPDETQFSLISFNVENFFDHIDDTGLAAEPKLSADDINIKQTKISYAIGTLLHCPTIVAIQEVEKAVLLEALAAAMADQCGWLYQVVHKESADGRGIDVAYLLDPTRVDLLSMELAQGCTTIETTIEDDNIVCPAGHSPLFSRPPLHITIAVEGRRYLLFNNHFKSKRGGAAATEPRRIEQANHHNQLIRDIVTTDPTASIIVMGDFNDFEDSIPLQTLEKGGLLNLMKRVPDDQRYSFVFGGAAQLIDGIFVSSAVEPFVHSVDIIHTNADYPDAFGQQVTPQLLPYKATDHDIPYVLFNLDEKHDHAMIALTEETAVPTDEKQSLFWVLIITLLILFGGAGWWLARKQR